MKSPVCDHAFAYEVVLNETPDTFDLFFAAHLGRQGNFDLTGELSVRSFLDLLHFVPKNFTVRITLRSIFGEQDLAEDNAAFAGVVVGFAVVFAVEFFARTIGSGCDG